MHIDKEFSPGDNITLEFEMPIRLLRQDVRVPKCGGKVAVAHGPILYCLENLDNPHDLMNQALGNETLYLIRDEKMLNSIPILRGINTKGEPLVFIPYAYWGNRGDSKMTVFLDDKV